MVEEIVVTAQRRSENLQNVPIAVTAITAKSLEASGVSGSQDLSTVTPGLHFTQAVGNATPFIRGVGTQAVGAGQEPSVATYVDGVYIAAMPSGMFSFNNIDRIEVLKGPQGTLFGRNATGGLINVVTKDPSFTPQGRASVGYGNYKTVVGNFYGTTKLADDLAGDLALYLSNQGEGYGVNLATGRDVNETTEFNIRSKLLWTPTDNDRFVLAADYGHVHSSMGVAVRPMDGVLPQFGVRFTGRFWDVNSDFQPLRTSTQYGASLHYEHEFSDLRLVSISAYRRSKASQGFDQDVTPVPGVNIQLNDNEQSFSQELQLVSKTSSPLSWIAGAYYFHSDAKGDPTDVTVAPIGLHLQAFGQQITNSIAVYGQATYALTSDTNLTGGLRYTYDHRELQAHDVINAAIVVPHPSQAASESKPTWRFALDHHFTDTVMGYVSYNRGFKSGTFNLEVPTAAALRPEILDAYEAGLKSDLLDHRLRLNAATFYYKYKDIQLTRTIAGTQQLLNAASATIYGLDIDATAVISEHLTLRGGLELLHDRYTDFPNAVLTTPNPAGGNTLSSTNASGNRMVRTPDATFDVAVDYKTPLAGGELGANLTYYYNSGWYAEADNRVKQSNYSLVSGQISWSAPGDRYRVVFWGKNLTNAKVWAQLSEQELADGGSVTAPRTYGATLEVSF